MSSFIHLGPPITRAMNCYGPWFCASSGQVDAEGDDATVGTAELANSPVNKDVISAGDPGTPGNCESSEL